MTKFMIIIQNYHDHDAKLKSHATKISSSNTKTNLKYEAKFWFSTPSFGSAWHIQTPPASEHPSHDLGNALPIQW